MMRAMEWLVLRVLDDSLRALGSVPAEYAAAAARAVAIPRLEDDLIGRTIVSLARERERDKGPRGGQADVLEFDGEAVRQILGKRDLELAVRRRAKPARPLPLGHLHVAPHELQPLRKVADVVLAEVIGEEHALARHEIEVHEGRLFLGLPPVGTGFVGGVAGGRGRRCPALGRSIVDDDLLAFRLRLVLTRRVARRALDRVFSLVQRGIRRFGGLLINLLLRRPLGGFARALLQSVAEPLRVSGGRGQQQSCDRDDPGQSDSVVHHQTSDGSAPFAGRVR